MVNWGILASVLVLVMVISVNYFVLPNLHESRTIGIGDTVLLPDRPLGAEGKTLVLFLEANCEFSRKSGYFYKRLSKALQGRTETKFVVMYPEKKEAPDTFLEELGIAELNRFPSDFKGLGVVATPTLILLEDTRIQQLWRGMLSGDSEAEVLRSLNLGIKDERMVDESFLLRPEISNRLRVVDLRERDSFREKGRQEALNIPFDEFTVRAINELSQSDVIVLAGNLDSELDDAHRYLSSEQFPNVYILNSDP